VVAIVRREVRTAAPERYTKRRSSDNQGKTPAARRRRNSIRPEGEPIS
jgi:hypothetical protein